jgi:hypothetical protein
VCPGSGRWASNSQPTRTSTTSSTISGASARWYEEDGLTAGEWVQFEATLSYLVLKQPYSDSLSVLLFADEPGRRRLVLHGSPEHLVGVSAPPVAEVSDLSASFGPNLKLMLARYVRSPEERTLLGRLLDMEDPFDPELAAPMTGYARITTAGDGGVVASPLFVAYARQ